jgi:hypothetical protein
MIQMLKPITEKIAITVRMAAPALSAVVIFLRMIGDCEFDPVPAPGLPFDVPPVFFVTGAICGVNKFAVMTLIALILHQPSQFNV